MPSRSAIHALVFAIAGLLAIVRPPTAQAWSPEPLPDAPVDRTEHSAIFDSIGARMVVFGGISVHIDLIEGYGPNSVLYTNDCWQLSLAGNPEWSALPTAGTPPAPRARHSAIFDPVGNRMLVFGGTTSDISGAELNDLWELTLSGTPTWTQLLPLGAPPAPRRDHTAIYDPVGRRMIVFGGRGASGDLAGTWQLDLSGTPTWNTMVTTGTAPNVSWRHVAVYDPIGLRMLVPFGNWDNDVLALSLAPATAGQWSVVFDCACQPFPDPPRERSDAAAAFDSDGNALALFNGTDATGPGYSNEFRDAWILPLGDPTPAWGTLSSLLGVAGLTAVSTSEPRQIVIFGGDDWDWSLCCYRQDSHAQTVRYRPPGAVLVPPSPGASGVTLACEAVPNPASSGLVVAFTLPDGAPATIEVLDVSGRRVLARSLGSGAGNHRARIAPPGAIAPGVYLLRLVQGRKTLVRRISIVR